MSASFAAAERATLENLESAIRVPRASAYLDQVADEVSGELAGDPGALLAWRPIPLRLYDALPDGIASSWVFVLRGGKVSGAERHPNSIQRVMSYRAGADMQTWNGRAWESHHLASDAQAPLEQRWLSIPINVWHRPVMAARDWVVVSFHTASAEELIEDLAADDEHPDRGSASTQVYAGRHTR